MNEVDFTFCAYCPRLCRHTCPVAVGTSLEAATPTSMATTVLLVIRGRLELADGLAAVDLCLGCGACTAHCKEHVPVGARLHAWRAEHEAAPIAEPLAPVEGDARLVCVVTDQDWSSAWARREGLAVARLRTGDALGHAAWRLGAADVPARVASHLAGREAATASGEVAAVLEAAGIPVRRLPAPHGERRYRTCHEGAAPGPDQLACCGRREGFAARREDLARQIAEENVRLLAGGEVACADEACAGWLRRHGARVAGPVDGLLEEG